MFWYLRLQAKSNIKKYIDEKLPEEYEKCLVGITTILREAWNTSQQTEDRREKIQALSLAKECYSMKLDLLTNATVVDDAIRFVSESEKSKDKDKEEQVKSSIFYHKFQEKPNPVYVTWKAQGREQRVIRNIGKTATIITVNKKRQHYCMIWISVTCYW